MFMGREAIANAQAISFLHNPYEPQPQPSPSDNSLLGNQPVLVPQNKPSHNGDPCVRTHDLLAHPLIGNGSAVGLSTVYSKRSDGLNAKPTNPIYVNRRDLGNHVIPPNYRDRHESMIKRIEGIIVHLNESSVKMQSYPRPIPGKPNFPVLMLEVTRQGFHLGNDLRAIQAIREEWSYCHSYSGDCPTKLDYPLLFEKLLYALMSGVYFHFIQNALQLGIVARPAPCQTTSHLLWAAAKSLYTE